jgi:ELWxxDGT repeat protein
MVADIMTALVNAAGTQTFGSNPSELAIMSNVVYFRAASSVITVGTSNITSDYELWKSDGLAANTVRVVDVEPGIGNSTPTYLTPMQTLGGQRLVFAATQGASNQEIYFTNGTVGDLASRDINPGANGSNPGPFVPMGNRIYFAATNADHGSELWATDGTPAGTYLVKDIYPGTLGSSPGLLTAAGNFLYFRASDASGTGLWRSDGTGNGTTKIFGTFAPISASLFQITALGNAANASRVFVSTAGSGTQELWVTDVTTVGTYRTCPDRTQPCGVPFASNPSDMTYIDGRMYFNATALPTVGGSLGAEPFVYP